MSLFRRFGDGSLATVANHLLDRFSLVQSDGRRVNIQGYNAVAKTYVGWR